MQDVYEYDIFLSFANDDEELVKPIWQEMCLSGLRVFWSDTNLKRNVGQSWFNVIQTALINSRHFVLVCSPNSLQSEWVKVEYETFYSQCFLKNQETRRLILLSTKRFDLSKLPPFLRNIQIASSLKEIIPVLGGTNIQELLAKNQELTSKLELTESENVKLRQQIQDVKDNLLELQTKHDKNQSRQQSTNKNKVNHQKKEKAKDKIAPGISSVIPISVSKEIEDITRQKLSEIELSVKYGTYGTAYVDDKNSQNIYRELRKVDDVHEVKRVLCQIIRNEKENIQVAWRAIVLLKYFREPEAIKYIKGVLTRTAERGVDNKFIHQSCIDYLDVVNRPPFTEDVDKLYLFAAYECPSPEARSLALRKLVENVKFHGRNKLRDTLIAIVSEDIDNSVRVEAIKQLSNFDLKDQRSFVNNLFQDGDLPVRRQAANLASKVFTDSDFSTLKDIFIEEVDGIFRNTIAQSLLKINQVEGERYLLSLLEYDDERLSSVVLNVFIQQSIASASNWVNQNLNTGSITESFRRLLESYKNKFNK